MEDKGFKAIKGDQNKDESPKVDFNLFINQQSKTNEAFFEIIQTLVSQLDDLNSRLINQESNIHALISLLKDKNAFESHEFSNYFDKILLGKAKEHEEKFWLSYGLKLVVDRKSQKGDLVLINLDFKDKDGLPLQDLRLSRAIVEIDTNKYKLNQFDPSIQAFFINRSAGEIIEIPSCKNAGMPIHDEAVSATISILEIRENPVLN
jgi:hypothetical protein